MDSINDISRLTTSSIPMMMTIDSHKWIYWTFIWLGLGSLLPFNFFITADPYFRYKLHDPTAPNTSVSRLESSYENAVTLCAAIPNLLGTIVVTFFCIAHVHKHRISASLIGIALCLLICFSLIFVDVHQWRGIFFIITMVLVMIQGVLCAVLLNCYFSITSALPSRYIQGFVTGQALGGLFVVICSIVSILFSSNISISAAIYFLLAIFVLVSNLITYLYLERSNVLKMYSSSMQEINNEHEPLLDSITSNDDRTSFNALTLRHRLPVAFKHTKWNVFGIFLTFICTLAVFPAYLSKIQPASPSINYPNSLWTTRLYAQFMTFLLFNVGDTLGRTISSKFQRPSIVHPRLLFLICLLRFLFIPLFGFCHFPNTNGYPYLFRNDFIYAILILLFAMSHGYCNSLNMMFAPRRVHTQLSGTAGALMLMASNSGIFFGSVVSYGVVAMFGDQIDSNHVYFQ